MKYDKVKIDNIVNCTTPCPYGKQVYEVLSKWNVSDVITVGSCVCQEYQEFISKTDTEVKCKKE